MSSSKQSATPALKPLEVLYGYWDMQIRWSPKTHKLAGGPPTVQGTARFDWIEDGHFLVQHQGGNGGPPKGRLLMGGMTPRASTASSMRMLGASRASTE